MTTTSKTAASSSKTVTKIVATPIPDPRESQSSTKQMQDPYDRDADGQGHKKNSKGS
jgi:hypothetical protein